jgi:hypothetical protein
MDSIVDDVSHSEEIVIACFCFCKAHTEVAKFRGKDIIFYIRFLYTPIAKM